MAAAIVGCLGGCGKKTEDADAPGEANAPATIAPLAASSTTEMIALLGNRPLMTVVVRDDGWAPLKARLDALPLTEIDRSLERMTSGPMAALLAVTDLLDVEVEGPPPSPGRDTSRPIVIGMFDVPASGPPGTTIATLAAADGKLLPMRNQVIIPATDAAALTHALQGWMSHGAKEAPKVVAGRAGAIGLRYGRGETANVVAIVPEGDRVRVVGFFGGGAVEDSVLAGMLDVEPAPLVDTPAMRLAVDAAYPAAILTRPWRIRAFATWMGMYETHRAVATVSIDQRDIARLRGYSIAAVAELLTPDDHAEFDDWALALAGTDEALHMTSVVSLTPKGQEIWKAGTTAPDEPLALKGSGRGQAFVSTDINAMLAKAGTHALPEGGVAEIAETVRDCGAMCSMYFVQRWPLALAKTATFGGPTEAIPNGSVSLQVAVDTAGREPKAAVAVQSGTDLTHLTKTFPELFGDATVTKRGTDSVLMFDLGLDPKAVFDPDGEGTKLEAGTVATMSAPAAGALTQPVRGTLRYRDAALVGQVVIGEGDFASAPIVTDLTWDSPLRDAAPAKADACLLDAARAVRALGDVSMAALDQRGMVYGKALAAFEEATRCAEGTPAAAAIERVTQTARLIAARTMVATLDLDEARALLDKACPDPKGASADACTMRTALQDVPMPEVPKHAPARACSQDRYYSGLGLPLIAGDGRVLLGTESHPATQDALIEALVDLTPPYDRSLQDAPDVALIVPPTTPFSKVEPLLSPLSAVKSTWHPIIDVDGEYRPLPLFVAKWPTTATVDWKVDPDAIPDDLLEEPPPEEDDPPRGEVGRMGKPSSGLYAMKGPKLRRDMRVQLSKTELTITLPTGEAQTLASVDDVKAVAELFPDAVATLEVSGDTPWSRLIALSVAACGMTMELVPEGSVKSPVAPPPEEPGGYGRIGFAERGKRVPRVRQAKSEVKGALDKDIIRRIVRSHINEVRACYNDGLAKNPDLSGRVGIQFTIGSDGKVSKTKVATTTLKDKAVGKCVAGAIKSWKFPRPKGGGVVVVTYPFVFEPGG